MKPGVENHRTNFTDWRGQNSLPFIQLGARVRILFPHERQVFSRMRNGGHGVLDQPVCNGTMKKQAPPVFASQGRHKCVHCSNYIHMDITTAADTEPGQL